MNKTLCLIVFLLVFTVISCSHPDENIMENSIEATNPIPNETAFPTWTLTSSPTSCPDLIPKRALTSTPTFSPVHIPSFTLEPTRLEQAKLISYDLIQNQNTGDCIYPCFWGIEPGKSHWSEERSFLEEFALEIISTGLDDTFGLSRQLVVVPVVESISSDSEISVVFFTSAPPPMLVEQISIYRPKNDTILNMFSLFGEPDEMYLWSTGLNIGDPQNMLALVYYDYGVLVFYVFDTIVTAEKRGGPAYVRICASDVVNIIPRKTRLWSPNNMILDITSIDFIEHVTGIGQGIKEFELATDTTISEFYTNVLEYPNSDFCVESDIANWGYEYGN